jgi:redox-sensitive bicupin YhaK (pirin superfamily)
VSVGIDVRRAVDRFETRADGLVSRHSFSFGPHYDPANTRFGGLVAHNDDVLSPGAGFLEHPHRDLEIVTWVIAGAVEHRDSSGGSRVLRPGIVGRLSTGAGVRHVETNASPDETRYVQMWVMPDADGPASYASADVSGAVGGDAVGLVVVASGPVPAPVSLRRRDATFLVARLAVGRSAALPAAALLHVFVAVGGVRLIAESSSISLTGGDAARVTDVADSRLEASADAEVLVWAMTESR